MTVSQGYRPGAAFMEEKVYSLDAGKSAGPKDWRAEQACAVGASIFLVFFVLFYQEKRTRIKDTDKNPGRLQSQSWSTGFGIKHKYTTPGRQQYTWPLGDVLNSYFWLIQKYQKIKAA